MTTGLAYLREHLDLEPVGRGQWVARCPVHEDNEPSLNITLVDKYGIGQWRLYFHCKAGHCNANGDDVCAALGMKRGLAFIPSSNDVASMEKPKFSRPLPSSSDVKEWQLDLGIIHDGFDPLQRLVSWRGFPDSWWPDDYGLGWDGQNYTIPIYRRPAPKKAPGYRKLINLLRCDPNAEPKKRRPRLWPGTHHCLYPNMPRTPRGFAIVCEGIWDALLGRAYGLPTVTGTGGAGYWNEAWSKALRGLGVFVIYDCDTAGRTGAQKVKASIPHAVVLDLAPRRRDGYDLSDHLRRYRTTERLMRMISAGRRK